jgi:hypothetical protein
MQKNRKKNCHNQCQADFFHFSIPKSVSGTTSNWFVFELCDCLLKLATNEPAAWRSGGV